MIKKYSLLLLLIVSACAHRTDVRFKDQNIIWQADDQSNIETPKETVFYSKANMARVFFTRRLTRFLEFTEPRKAMNLNALEEVPDSTWFTNRIGQVDLSTNDLAKGPLQSSPPQPPFTIFKGKSIGSNPGFFVKDQKGRSYLVKFDAPENPEMQTGTNNVISRFFWALGYNVPEDFLVFFTDDEITLSPKATVKNEIKEKIPMTKEFLSELLEKIPQTADGRYRATFSQWLDGRPLGGFSPEGIRIDDPNDKIPHQHRREIRALRVFSMWLGHTDMKVDNTLDMFVEENGKKFVKHYLLDFGEALGAHQAEKKRLEDGWEYGLDWENQFKALFSLGLWLRPWEKQTQTPWLAIGAFSAEHFEPELWREFYPYWPFAEMDLADAYWAVKKILLFDREKISAIVKTAQFSDSPAHEYLVDTLLKRQKKIAKHYLSQIASLDWFSFEGDFLCVTDIATHYGIEKPGTLVVKDELGKETQHSFSPTGSACFRPSGNSDYLVQRLKILRERSETPYLQVHLKLKEKSRILGLVRYEN